MLPDAAFIDQYDRRRSIAEWRGSVVAADVHLHALPAAQFLPAHGSTLRDAAGRPGLRCDASRAVKLVHVSFDPELDTPAVLAAHAAKLKADPDVWTFLTGDRATVDRFAAAWCRHQSVLPA